MWRTKYSALALISRSANGGGWASKKPGVVVDGRLCGHLLELVDGRDDVQNPETLHGFRVVQRHPVGGAAATVVADDREAPIAGLGHHLDELGRDLALAVALPERAAARGAALAAALQVADDDRVVAAERRGDPAPAVVILRKPVQEQDGRSLAGHPHGVGRPLNADRPVLKAVDAELAWRGHAGES